MSIEQGIKPCGFVQRIIEYKSGEKDVYEFPNTVLFTGRQALASVLANSPYNENTYYITNMLFGGAGTDIDGNTKVVYSNRNGLFGATLASKVVVATIDPEIPTQAIFTAVLSYTECNGETLNEMALQMANDDFYSMVTFPNLSKTSSMQITWNWRLSFV